LVFGGSEHTEILDASTNVWRPYRNAPLDWDAFGCLVQDGDMIYHLGFTAVEAIDLTAATDGDDFVVIELAPMPAVFRTPQKCSLFERNGVKGL